MKPKKPKPGQSLADKKPELAKQWHPTKNGNLTPFDVSSGSSMKIWWKCSKEEDHVWNVSVSNRNAGWGCPYCSGRKVAKSTSLGILNPELAKEWHPIKNGNLTPFDITPNSQKKVWWKCPKGDDHEWDAIVSDRNNGIGCAVCSNYKVVKSNCLSTLKPKLASEWHPTKNGNLTPEDVHPGSSRKVWWKCPKGDDHEWQTVVHSRSNGRGCPVCSGRKVVPSTSLKILNPELAKQWHPTRNGNKTPEEVGINSSFKVWWKCPKGDDHEWQSTVHHRTIGLGCPICSNQKIVESNSLATLNPELSREWHPTKNGKLTPSDVGPGSGRNVWWKCNKGSDHEWRASIARRHNGRGCPVCIGRKVVRSNCLATLYPELAKQWHPSKNGKTTPFDLRPGSTKRAWWVCSNKADHIWITSVKDRVQGTGCPHCSPQTSAPEQRIYFEMKSIFPNAKSRTKILGVEVDILIPELNLGIEYDGVYWHANKISKDQEKNDILDSEIMLVRVREPGLKQLSVNDIVLKNPEIDISDIKKIIQIILKYKLSDSSHLLSEMDEYLKRNHWKADDQFKDWQANRSQVNYEDSIAFMFPKLAKQWHPSKNAPLLPSQLTAGSKKKVWWKNSSGREWQARIADRVNRIKSQDMPGQMNFFEGK